MPDSQKLTTPEMFNFSTIRLECNLPGGGISTGTGFFFTFCEEEGGKHIPAIVTNKHVVQGATSGRFYFHLAESAEFSPPFRSTGLVIDHLDDMWIDHPDPNVDLCVAFIGPLIHHAESHERKLFYIPLTHALLPSEKDIDDFQGLEDIVMIGYPNGLWDAHNNMPIMRRGTVATHPKLDYEGRREFLIDAACFPGSSGSPVLLFDRGAVVNRHNSVQMGRRVKLLGILYGGHERTTTGEIRMMAIPTGKRPVAVSNIPINLGVVIKSERLREFEPVIERIVETPVAVD